MEAKSLPVSPSFQGSAKDSSTTRVDKSQGNGNLLHLQANPTGGNTGLALTNSIPTQNSTPVNKPGQSNTITNQVPSSSLPQTQSNNNAIKPKGKPSQVPSRHQAIRQHPLHIAPKYAKIQPAIAPKPTSSVPLTTKFNPIPSSKFQLLMKSSLSSQDATNLNTSKKWILPPRPRPGRKRTGGECDKIVKAQTNATKRKAKIKLEAGCKTGDGKEKLEKTTLGSSSTTARTTASNPTTKKEVDTGGSATADFVNTSKGTTRKTQITAMSTVTQPLSTEIKREPITVATALSKTATTPETTQSRSQTNGITPLVSDLKSNLKPLMLVPAPPAPPPPTTKSEDPKAHMTELKLSYLAKLKEQEIIRNYVEVLTNQIKELSFVQNGVITFDALKNSSKVTPDSQRITSTLSKSKCDQLDSINNLNDLNKFLNYLSKSSDIIKSAKRQPNEHTATPDNLNQQIDSYVQLRQRFKMLNQQNGKKINKKKACKQQQQQQVDNSKDAEPTASSSASATTPKHASPKSPFTPDLLRPLNASNLFNDPNLDMMEMDLQTETIKASPSTAEILTDNNEVKSAGDGLTMEFEGTKYGDNDVGGDAGGGDGDNGEFFHIDEHDFLSRLALDDTTEEPDLGEVVIHKQNGGRSSDATDVNGLEDKGIATEVNNRTPATNDMIMRKKVKFNCGFCTNDTPCLCFDSDLEISRLG